MDNLTHSLVGLAAAKAGLGRLSPYATAACVVAANIPDADILALLRGSTFYLEHHRGITHSIVGTLALGLLLPVLILAVDRLAARVRRRPPRARFGGLLLCSLLLAASHPLLDWTNSYGLRPYLPWDESWIYGDLVFILDPFIWLFVGGATFLLTSSRWWSRAVWFLLASVLSFALLYVPVRAGLKVPTVSFVVWFGGIACFIAARWLSAGERFWRAVPAASLALLVAYWGALALFHTRALQTASASADELALARGEVVQKVAAMPLLADPTLWLVTFETDRATYRYQLSLDDSSEDEQLRDLLRFEKPAGADKALIAHAETDERVRVLLDFARFPVVKMERTCTGQLLARFADLRFTEPGTKARGNFAVDVPVNSTSQ